MNEWIDDGNGEYRQTCLLAVHMALRDINSQQKPVALLVILLTLGQSLFTRPPIMKVNCLKFSATTSSKFYAIKSDC